MKKLPTKKELDKLFSYDAETGELRYKLKRRMIKIGEIAGHKQTNMDGITYLVISIYKNKYFAHRICWIMAGNKFIGNEQIDHINHNSLDNRICNLRKVTNKENGRNCKLSKNNKSGTNGVYFRKNRNKWSSFIHVDYIKINLGLILLD